MQDVERGLTATYILAADECESKGKISSSSKTDSNRNSTKETVPPAKAYHHLEILLIDFNEDVSWELILETQHILIQGLPREADINAGPSELLTERCFVGCHEFITVYASCSSATVSSAPI